MIWRSSFEKNNLGHEILYKTATTLKSGHKKKIIPKIWKLSEKSEKRNASDRKTQKNT